MHIQPDYPNEYETTKLPPQHAGRLNGFGTANNFRASFNAFPNANRTQVNPSAIGATSLRDTSNFYPTSADVFPAQVTSPIQTHMQQFEANPSFEFGGHKGFIENFSPNGPMLPHHGGRPSISHAQHQAHHKFTANHQFGGGVQLTSQTPYGPHLPAVGMNNAGNQSQGSNTQSSRDAGNSNAGNTANQEEISTIFVVGFPEDMQEREFQNMFTFSAGFEAATLKIPNKEYTAYGANALRGFPGYNGSNDPYNLVTVNQGGVVVDNGRDGTMSSWPAVVGDDGPGNHFVGVNLPPRKQIIGFAKFKSREAALEARDVLQGRRVDIEKGAVLKAEMAKKNLHTKRGVGPVAGPAAPGPINASNSMQNNAHGPLSTHHNNESFALPGDTFPPRDLPLGGIDLGRLGTFRDQLQKDVHAITNGIGSAQSTEFHPRKDREDEEYRRNQRDSIYNAMGFTGSTLGQSATRGPRERAEEEERERRRKEKEARLRANNSTAFDAFHSVPAGNAPALSRQNSGLNGIANEGTLLAPMQSGSGLGSSPLLSNSFTPSAHDEVVGPWDKIPNIANGISRPRSSSQRSVSPPDLHDRRDSHYSPPTDSALEQTGRQHRGTSESSASSVVGAHSAGVIGGGTSVGSNGSEQDLNKAMKDLALDTANGTTSPQLPSPASGASSQGTKGAIDQNPPINTLYVGNLPAPSPSIGFSNDQLEDAIRQLFMAQPGYRRLVFRQKNNGPMCFVEFEDVHFATRALNELYGHTLGGLVKSGGIRLSYSKNPLGVRTPTSAGGNNNSFQHQQAMQSLTFQSDAFQSRGGEEHGSQPHISRRDTGGPFGNSFLTSPPPRFTSPPMHSFGQTSLTNAPNSFGLRTNGGSLSSLYSFSLAGAGALGNSASSTNFSPFGISSPPTIPEHHSSSDEPALHSHHFGHRTLSPPVNVEAARAG
ncbi:hypothetical protein CC1G_01410 [Coprinopsis cinerea okayama7|uniref:RRM domain-containing protein n=1 Tax=Coprinopsis cinerea (strain Okayama-7 / 130 / ATCC MYA-4618 / FGSC 9003) TaxID=240176 RepID=A8NYR2_COPC7|nr:hypothetical protein CC1G_01410 [Coprinopsis cinerea okayama7\|eukprot:XP_001837498.2 hypothetical protein CC1G_01410 [Coprinopsis cinerea okayama7\